MWDMGKGIKCCAVQHKGTPGHPILMELTNINMSYSDH